MSYFWQTRDRVWYFAEDTMIGPIRFTIIRTSLEFTVLPVSFSLRDGKNLTICQHCFISVVLCISSQIISHSMQLHECSNSAQRLNTASLKDMRKWFLVIAEWYLKGIDALTFNLQQRHWDFRCKELLCYCPTFNTKTISRSQFKTTGMFSIKWLCRIPKTCLEIFTSVERNDQIASENFFLKVMALLTLKRKTRLFSDCIQSTIERNSKRSSFDASWLSRLGSTDFVMMK